MSTLLDHLRLVVAEASPGPWKAHSSSPLFRQFAIAAPCVYLRPDEDALFIETARLAMGPLVEVAACAHLCATPFTSEKVPLEEYKKRFDRLIHALAKLERIYESRTPTP